jgi:outer membrane protein assembly factor BamB/orotate phosphoribosyltransferase
MPQGMSGMGEQKLHDQHVTTITTTTVTVTTSEGATTTTTTTSTAGAAVASIDVPDDLPDDGISPYATHPVSRMRGWETLRREIVKRAVSMTDHVVCDFRLLLTIGRNAEIAGRLMWQLIKPFKPEVLVGPGYGGAPLLFSTLLAARAEGVELTALMVRDKRKDHNLKKWVEGHRPRPKARAVMLDDFMERGSAIGMVEEALKGDKIDLDLVAVGIFFDMWQPLGTRQLSVGKYSVVSLYRRHDIGLSRDCFDAKPPKMIGVYPDFVTQPLWWRFGLNDKPDYPLKCVPVIADNAVFVADDHARVYRHDAATGELEWEYESLDDPPKGIPELLTYADGSLVFGCYDGTVTRLDAKSGEIRWRWRQDSSVHATPDVDLATGRVFINTEQYNNGKPFGHLQALDWATGRVLWKYAHAYWPPASPILHRETQTVIACCNDQTVVGVDAATGALRWKRKTVGLARGKPAVAGGLVFVGTENGRLHAFNASDGEPVWTVRYGKSLFHQFVYAEGDVVYALDGKWHLTAFDRDTGAIRWLSRMRSPGCWGPVPFGRYLVVLSTGGQIAVYDPELELKVWENSIGGLYRQPGAVGWMKNPDGSKQALLAAASNTAGLKVFEINPFYVGAEAPAGLAIGATAKAPHAGNNGVATHL